MCSITKITSKCGGHLDKTDDAFSASNHFCSLKTTVIQEAVNNEQTQTGFQTNPVSGGLPPAYEWIWTAE